MRAPLRNLPSLSHSYLRTLDVCPRRAWWQRFGAWGGWDHKASDETRLAYRLKNMRGIYALVGVAVEEQCRRALDAARRGEPVVAEALVTGARAHLARAWREHQSRGWMHSPKRSTCIAEVYYGDSMPGREKIDARLRDCFHHFLDGALPRLLSVPAGAFLAVDQLESFGRAGVKVYAIPDFAFSLDGVVSIVDLKTGRPSAATALQLGLYALWAFTRFPEIDTVTARAEYLLSGEVITERWRRGELGWVEDGLSEGLEKYRALLVGGDLEKHEARPMAEWPATTDERECRRCEYREVCRPELVGSNAHETRLEAAVGG